MEPKIPAVNLQFEDEALRAEIEAAIRRVLEHRQFILGPEVCELEQALAQRTGCSHAIACASGSDALLLSLLALGVQPGDRVLVPAFTFFATAGSVVRAGATPAFADIDPQTFNISPAAAETALESKPTAGRIQAMIPVHLYGQCAAMDRLLALAERHGVLLIEDAAQAILARHQGRPAGSMGICGCFSFFPTKNLGAFGDGGMITTQDRALAERLRALRDHGAVKKQAHSFLGLNSRLDTLQAAILLVKLRRLERWTRLRQEKSAFYRNAFLEAGLSDAKAIYPNEPYPVVLPHESPHADSVYHQFTVRAASRDELQKHLASRGIEAVVYYPVPLHLQPAFGYLGGQTGDFPEAERAAREALSLPLYPEIAAEQQRRVVEEIQQFYSSPGKRAAGGPSSD